MPNVSWLMRITGIERLRKLLDDIACLLVDIKNIVQTRQLPMPAIPPPMVHAILFGFADNQYMSMGGSVRAGGNIKLQPYYGMRKCILFVMTDLEKVAVTNVYSGVDIPFAGAGECPIAFISEIQLGQYVMISTEMRK